MKGCSLYIHLPFCKSKCQYCSFVSFVGCQDKIPVYFEALKKELLRYRGEMQDYIITTVFIGGGTPSLVPAFLISDLLEFIREQFKILDEVEITVEANPESFDYQKAKTLYKAGVNRMSFGLQTDNDEVLAILGRPHTFEEYKQVIISAKEAGFVNINTDILLAIPQQTIQSAIQTVHNIAELGLTHISAYGLIIEPNTPLHTKVETGEVVLPSDDESVAIYNAVNTELNNLGYQRYEISNFAKPGYQCRHNVNYWARGEYLGIGVGAYSFMGRKHWQNVSNLDKYLANPTRSAVDEELETLKTAKEETIMLALRTIKGLNIEKYNQTFNEDFCIVYKKLIKNLLKDNLIKIENGYLSLINMSISNAIIEKFF